MAVEFNAPINNILHFSHIVLLGYLLDDQGIVVQFLVRARTIAFLQKRRDRLWCPNILLFSGYQGFFP